MDRDGTRDGYDLALTRAIADRVTVPVIASGGVGNVQHLVEGVREGHASAVLAASIFHFGQHSLAEARDALRQAGLPVRRCCTPALTTVGKFYRSNRGPFEPFLRQSHLILVYAQAHLY